MNLYIFDGLRVNTLLAKAIDASRVSADIFNTYFTMSQFCGSRN